RPGHRGAGILSAGRPAGGALSQDVRPPGLPAPRGRAVSDAILEVEGISKSFGGVRAVDDVTMRLLPGEIVGLIGPNGAGKTTLVNLMTGVLRPSSGVVRFSGRDVTRQKPHQASQRGIARTFQIVQPF